jgi:uroporphyrinogen decarboxylase
MAQNGFSRREFLMAGVVFSSLLSKERLAAQMKSQMSKPERVKAALRGERVDRVPFTFWHHFGLEKLPGEKHAEATVGFYRKFDVDLLKVMSDFPYPLPEAVKKVEALEDWQRLEPLKNPFPEQIRALRLINKELKGQVPFVETIFQPWTVAEKFASKKALTQLKDEDPKLLKKVLRTISESQANHARLALDAGAAGIFLAVAAADDFVMDPQEYVKLVRESDLMILDSVKDKSYLNILHVHGKKPHFDSLVTYPVQVMNYSTQETGINLSAMRRKFMGTLMGGLNEAKIASQTAEELGAQIHEASVTMQKRRFILSPGCSVPNDIADEPLLKVRELVQKS